MVGWRSDFGTGVVERVSEYLGKYGIANRMEILYARQTGQIQQMKNSNVSKSFSLKIGFDVSCKLSSICMKYQSIISEKKKKKKKEKYFNMSSAEILPSMLSVNNSPTILHCRIDLKYWNALAIFIASPRIYNCPCPVCWCVSGLSAGLCEGRCSTWSDAVFCGTWSWSILFAQACLS